MTSRIHFISGLPRSGSTLLSAVLRQNPRFRASVESPVADLLAQTVKLLSSHEAAFSVTDAQRHRVCLALIESYYALDHPGTIVFDSHRAWCSMLSVIADLFPTAWVLCCVRNPAWIIDSVECLVQKNALWAPKFFGYEPGNVYSRADHLSKTFVGASLRSVKQAWFGEESRRLIIVPYEALVDDPGRVIGSIYERLDEPAFAHDFDHVTFDAPEFDARLAVPGMHRVSGPVRRRVRPSILPTELFRQYDHEFWKDREGNPRNVLVL